MPIRALPLVAEFLDRVLRAIDLCLMQNFRGPLNPFNERPGMAIQGKPLGGRIFADSVELA